MAKLSIAFIVLVSSISGVLVLPGCHNNNTAGPSAKLSLKDEKTMRLALEGTWILKEYMDSIDAGLTPKLLEYMLGPRSCISYHKGEWKTAGLHLIQKQFKYYEENGSEQYELRFDPANNKFIIKISADTTALDSASYATNAPAQVKIIEIDTGELVINDGDTILRILENGGRKDFARYGVGSCKGITPFNHLANSKFIAGKYYSVNDPARARHIIFTKCGNIEGVEYIEPTLKGRSEYALSISYFSTGPDALEFYDPRYKMGIEYYWEVNKDSLIIKPATIDGKAQRIVLIKAQ